MPLTSVSLQNKIRTNLVALSFVVDNADLTAFCDAIASAVVSEITTNALVMPVALVAPPGGGPVTGTGTVT
jgi:hypothetical protein